jgi:hypothetical protein
MAPLDEAWRVDRMAGCVNDRQINDPLAAGFGYPSKASFSTMRMVGTFQPFGQALASTVAMTARGIRTIVLFVSFQ